MHDDPMKPYKNIAREHGVNPDDEPALIKFYEETIPTLPADELQRMHTRILSETTGLPMSHFTPPTLPVEDTASDAGETSPTSNLGE